MSKKSPAHRVHFNLPLPPPAGRCRRPFCMALSPALFFDRDTLEKIFCICYDKTMKEKMQKILEKFHKYNTEHMANLIFGLSDDITYDALVVAPSYTPYKLKLDAYCTVTLMKEADSVSAYLIEKDGMKIAWVKVGISASNLIDYLSLCAELSFKKMIFVGSVGALNDKFELGDICTPSYSISGVYANTYLKDSLKDFVLFEKVVPDLNFVDCVINSVKYDIKKASIFCTDSIALEYYHLDEIKAFGTDLIEMETSSFYLMADLLEIPSIALLIVSDNSATGTPLVGRTEAQDKKFYESRTNNLSNLILDITKMQLN